MADDVESAELDRQAAEAALTSERVAHQMLMERLQATLEAAEVRLQQAQVLADAAEDDCPLSPRPDNSKHSWLADGGEPRLVCSWCGEVRDSLDGHVIVRGRTADEVDD